MHRLIFLLEKFNHIYFFLLMKNQFLYKKMQLPVKSINLYIPITIILKIRYKITIFC